MSHQHQAIIFRLVMVCETPCYVSDAWAVLSDREQEASKGQIRGKRYYSMRILAAVYVLFQDWSNKAKSVVVAFQ